MKNICNNCGKYSTVDEFGYCEKCSKRLFKEGKHITSKQVKMANKIKRFVFLFIVIIFIAIFFYFRNDIAKIGCSTFNFSNSPVSAVVESVVPIEDKTLTADNYETLSKEYANNNKNTDNVYYFSYACLYYISKDGLSSAFNTSLSDKEKESTMYSKIYGKTIKQLISEGKQLMLDNNVTIDNYKKSLNDLNNMNNVID